MGNYRIRKKELLNEISGWNRFFKRKMHLIVGNQQKDTKGNHPGF